MTTVLLPAPPTTRYRILTLPDAARATGWSMDELQRAIETGKIVAGVLDDGSVAVVIGPDNSPLQIQNNELPLAAAADGQTQPAEDEDINARLRKIRRENFAHLEGVEITAAEAAQKYNVPRSAIYRWINSGYIRVLREVSGRRGKALKMLNEADVAICSEVYKVRKMFNSLAPLLDEQGEPYLLKYPDLSRKRRSLS